MYLLRLGLRPWRTALASQAFSALAVGILLCFCGFLHWLQQGLNPVLNRLQQEQVITAYLGSDVEERDQARVIDTIRVSLGAAAEVRLVDPSQFIGSLKGQFPDLARELEGLGPEAMSVVPRFVTVSGTLAVQLHRESPRGPWRRRRRDLQGPSAPGDRRVPGPALDVAAADRRPAPGAAHGPRPSRADELASSGGRGLAASTLGRLAKCMLRAPSMLAGASVGLLGGIAGVAGWLFWGTWLIRHVRALSPVLHDLPAAGGSIAMMMLMGGVAIGARERPARRLGSEYGRIAGGNVKPLLLVVLLLTGAARLGPRPSRAGARRLRRKPRLIDQLARLREDIVRIERSLYEELKDERGARTNIKKIQQLTAASEARARARADAADRASEHRSRARGPAQGAQRASDLAADGDPRFPRSRSSAPRARRSLSSAEDAGDRRSSPTLEKLEAPRRKRARQSRRTWPEGSRGLQGRPRRCRQARERDPGGEAPARATSSRTWTSRRAVLEMNRQMQSDLLQSPRGRAVSTRSRAIASFKLCRGAGRGAAQAVQLTHRAPAQRRGGAGFDLRLRTRRRVRDDEGPALDARRRRTGSQRFRPLL